METGGEWTYCDGAFEGFPLGRNEGLEFIESMRQHLCIGWWALGMR